MRLLLTKDIKLVPPALIVIAFVYYATLSTPLIKQDKQAVTLILSENQAKVLLSGRRPEDVSQVPHDVHGINETSASDTQRKGSVEIIVLNNRVYNKKSSKDMEAFNKTVRDMGYNFQRDTLSEIYGWPPVLKPSNASHLLEVKLDKYSLQDRQILEERLGEMVSRARLVGLACRNFPMEQEAGAGPSHLLWDLGHNPSIVWCPNYKVASTTWMINFLRLAHFNENNPAIPDNKPDRQFSVAFGARHDAVYKYYPTPPTSMKAKVLKKSVRLIIVRHPFTRLLSAYRDKMTKMHPKPAKFHFRKIQNDIIFRYRSANSPIKSPHPTFPEFVQFVIDDTKNITSGKDWRKAVKCWVPFWAQCNICTTDYNVIMKLETMGLDERFLITLSKLKELKKLKTSEWRHLKNSTSNDLASDYYNQITRDQMLSLYESYKLDFEAFDYKIDDYLSIAKEQGGSEVVSSTSKVPEV